MKRKLLVTLLSALTVTGASAQEENLTPMDTLTNRVGIIQNTLDILGRIKFSGYLQPQFQVADSVGIQSFAGGNFAPGVDKRFILRRARVKIQYDSPNIEKGWSISQYVFQIDLTENGATIKDMYARFTDPWIGWFSVTAGMQNRPFGYEIGYSSSMRESPERARLWQTVFRNERDLGAMMTIQGPKLSNWNWIKLEAGMFNGPGGPSAGQALPDFDYYKDFIGHLSFARSNFDERIKFGGGVSYYHGGFRLDNDTVFSIGSDTANRTVYVLDETGFKGQQLNRIYWGADAQFSIDWAPGITTLRGEYVSGEQPNASNTSTSPFVPVTGNGYRRNFNGAYFYFLQNILQTPVQLVVKYDWYDPNTDVEGDDLGKGTTSSTIKRTNSTDVKYTTLGVGLAYRWDANVKITGYYDMVENETSANLANFTQDISDNVFTLRVQVKF